MLYPVDLQCQVGKYLFPVNSFRSVEGYKILAATCELELPRSVRLNGEAIVANSIIKEGDPVTVEGGYRGRNHFLLEGFVRKLRPGLKIGLELEDAGYWLKRFDFTASYESVTLDTLIKAVVAKGKKDLGAKWPFESVNVNISTSLGKLRINRASGAAVLEDLRKRFGIDSFVRDNVLYIGQYQIPGLAQTHNIHFDRHVVDDSNLEWEDTTDQKFQVTAISFIGNEQIEYKTGTAGGAHRPLFYYGLDKSGLIAAAKRDLKKLGRKGWRGNFEMYGHPFIRPGDIMRLYDPRDPDHIGSAIVEQVTRMIDVNTGFRQTIKLSGRE